MGLVMRAARAPRFFSSVRLATIKWTALAALVIFLLGLQIANWLVFHSASPALNLVWLSVLVLAIVVAAHFTIFRVVESREGVLEMRARDLAIADERLRISKEMHDGVAQVLAYCNTKLLAVDEFLAAGRTAEAREHLEDLARTSREIYADVREGILGLQTVSLQEPLATALRAYVENWQDQCGIKAELVVDEEFSLEPSEELQLVRIVQEALSNVRKHSKARTARIEMKAASEAMTLVVEDDGAGFRTARIGPGRFPRFGLSTMKQRADSINARLAIESEPGRGTRVQLDVPRCQ